MKPHTPGSSSKGICEDCKAIVPTTFTYRDVPFSDGSGTVKNILVAVCDQCDGVVAIPAQSIPAIRRARTKHQKYPPKTPLPQDHSEHGREHFTAGNLSAP